MVAHSQSRECGIVSGRQANDGAHVCRCSYYCDDDCHSTSYAEDREEGLFEVISYVKFKVLTRNSRGEEEKTLQNRKADHRQDTEGRNCLLAHV